VESPTSFGASDQQIEQGQPVIDTDISQPETNQAIQFPPWMDAAKLLGKVRGWRDQWNQYSQNMNNRLERNWKLYECKSAFGQGDNAEILPLPASIVDTQQARLMGAILAQEKFGDAVPKDIENVMAADSEERTGKVEDLINEAVNQTESFEDKMDELSKNMFVETVMIAEVKWNVKTDQILKASKQIDPVTKMETVGEAQMTDYECAAPDFEAVSCRYMGWEPRASGRLSQALWTFRRKKSSADELHEMEADGVIADADKAIRQTGNQSDGAPTSDRSDPQAAQMKNVEGVQIPVADKDGLLNIEVWHANLSGETTDETGEKKRERGEFRFWMVGDVCVKFSPNPFGNVKPYVMSRMSRKPDQILGQGPIDLIVGMMRNLTANISSLNSLIRQTASNPIFYEPTTMLDGRRTILQENDLVPVLSVDGIKRMEPPIAAIKLIREQIEFLITQIREATASNEQAQGIQAQGDTTATEAQIMANSANLRTQYTANMVAANFFSELMWFYFKMYQRFGTPENMIIHEAGTDGKPSSLQISDLIGDYYFKPILAVSQSSKNSRFAMLKQLVTELGQASAANPGFLKDSGGNPMELNTYEFLTEKMLPLIDIYGAQKLFKQSPPPPPPAPVEPEKPHVTLSINGQDAMAMGLTPAIQKEFGAEPTPVEPPMPDMGNGMPDLGAPMPDVPRETEQPLPGMV
jgi:hypothetical protein